MKIGILTFHRALNYGAVLQCYALFTVLKEMGHDVEVIDYRAQSIEKERKAINLKALKNKSWPKRLETFVLVPFRFVFRRKAAKTFDTFLSKYIRLSHPVFTSKDIPAKYDLVVFGSDQIWSPILCGGFNDIYYGQFPKGKARFISYAASLEGFDEFTLQQWNSLSRKLDCFDAIAVREKSFRDELAKKTGKKIDWVVDPTLLVSPVVLKRIAQKPPYSRYIFLFTVQGGVMPYKIAQYLATKEGYTVIRARASARLNLHHKEKNVRTIYAADPSIFVGLIDNAEYVVTNSFHATAISLQMKKNFFVVQCEHPNRMVDLLRQIHLEDRYVNHPSDLACASTIDYERVHAYLKDMSHSSYDYLTANIHN